MLTGLRIFIVISILALSGFMYAVGVGGPALEVLDWIVASAGKFFSSLLNFFDWLF